MENYTVSSVGQYIVLLESLEQIILFSLKKYEFITAGEVTIDGKRHVIMHSMYNTFQTIPLDSLTIDADFTSELPKDIKNIKGYEGLAVKIDDNKYAEIRAYHDYFMYNFKIYVTGDYYKLYETDYNSVNNSTHCGTFVEDFEYLPCGKPYHNDFTFIGMQDIGLQIFVVNRTMYYTTGEYIPVLSFDEGALISGCKDYSQTRYYLSTDHKNVFLIELYSNKKINLTDDITKAARPPNFGAIYKFPDMYDIEAGKGDYGNIILKTDKNPGLADLYSTVGANEIIFCITQENDIYIIDHHEYPAPKATKAAINQTEPRP